MKAQIEIKSFIQPFERELAVLELAALSGTTPVALDGDASVATVFEVTGDFEVSQLEKRLSYWRSVKVSEEVLTHQIRAEATSIIANNGLDAAALRDRTKELVPHKLPNRRCLRYASHGLHEYRGKFFPQLVRALINIGQVPDLGIVLDPMCGSGTTLVEAKSSGHVGIGIDMNPLSIFLADIKCQVLDFDAETLINSFDMLSQKLQYLEANRQNDNWRDRFAATDQKYLGRWFSEQCLMELDYTLCAIDAIENAYYRDFFRVCLSNVLRPVSYQKDADLRVRKEVKDYSTGELQTRFINACEKSVKLAVCYLSEFPEQKSLLRHRVIAGDARGFLAESPDLHESVDAIITSPPYATALPYLDTDRLSLIVLGLLERSEHRARDLRMIGNREITERLRRNYWETFESERELLPLGTRELIERVHYLNLNADVGFRRKNLSSLLAKYFLDMRSVLDESYRVLKSGAPMYLVVGNNRTTAGGQDVEIETASHLAELGKMIGFECQNRINMDMLASRDIFKGNAMASEQIVCLRKPQ